MNMVFKNLKPTQNRKRKQSAGFAVDRGGRPDCGRPRRSTGLEFSSSAYVWLFVHVSTLFSHMYELVHTQNTWYYTHI